MGQTARIFRQPCSRENLKDIIAFRAGNSRAGKVRSEAVKFVWASDDADLKHVELSYPFKDRSNKASLKLTCGKFVPRDWDVLTEPWTLEDGKVAILRSTPYACVSSTLVWFTGNTFSPHV